MPKTSNNLLRFLPQLFLAGLVLLCGVWRHPGRPGRAADLAAAPRSGYTDSNYAPAALVLGAPDFTTHAGAGSGPAGMSAPSFIAVDPATGKVFVADERNNRVLRFARFATLANGAAAEAVFGQPDFSSHTAAAGPGGMSGPGGLAVDAAGRLWVAEWGNHRILRFDHAASRPSGAPADGVLGQPDFSANQPGGGPQHLTGPAGLAVDAAGRLWVADCYNSRVLRFEAAAAKPNGAPADGVLGQPDFSSPVGPDCNDPSAREVCYPFSLFFDPARQVLWVADGIFDRVLAFADPRPPVVVYLPLVIR